MVKVLVIHNKQHLVASLRRSLQRQGIMVLTCLDGNAGIQLALTARPDLLVVGDSVPFSKGGSLAAHLRERPELSGTRVITITQRIPAAVTESALHEAEAATLELPFRPSALCALVRPGG